MRRKGGKGTGSRHPAGQLTSPAELASGATRKLRTLKASNGGEAGGSYFLGDSAGLAGGILKGRNQEGDQRLRNYKKEVLSHIWRNTSNASTVGRGTHCHSKTPSSCGGRRSPRGIDPGAQHAGRRETHMEKHPSGQPQGRQAGGAIGHHFLRACQGHGVSGLRSRGSRPPIDDRLRVGFCKLRRMTP